MEASTNFTLCSVSRFPACETGEKGEMRMSKSFFHSTCRLVIFLFDNLHRLSRTEPFIASGNHLHTGFYGTFDFYHTVGSNTQLHW